MDCCISDITVAQIELMQHAIGFSKNKVTGTKHRIMHAYRNRFYDKKHGDWEILVQKGLASRDGASINGLVCYIVTQEGLEFLGKLCGIKIIEID